METVKPNSGLEITRRTVVGGACEFRLIDRSEVESAYAVYRGVLEWLTAKGVRQWLQPLRWEVFVERERGKELFGYFSEKRLIAVVSLAFEASPWWPELGEGSRWWIKTLAVDRRWRGAGVGVTVMEECERRAWKAGAEEISLDCVDIGFLPGYYTRLGYTVLGRKDITYPSGNTFLVALMRKKRLNIIAAPTPE